MLNHNLICAITVQRLVVFLGNIPALLSSPQGGFEWLSATDFDDCLAKCEASTGCVQFGYLPPPKSACVLAQSYFRGFTGNTDLMQWGQK